MAEEGLTIAGSHKKAISDGTAVRNGTKAMAKKLPRVLLALVGLAAFVWIGYQFFDWAWSESNDTTNEVSTNGDSTKSRSGKTTAPTKEWSDWINVLDIECVYWQGTDPSGNRFKVQYVNPDGQIVLYDGRPLTPMRGVRFRSLTGSDEGVTYRIVTKQNGKC